MTKECRICGMVKAVGEFRKGHRRCKACVAEYMRAYRQQNRDALQEAERRWYLANREYKIAYAQARFKEDREAILERRRVWYVANREAEAKRNKERYWQDPESRRELARQWAREHPEKIAVKSHRRRAIASSATLSDAEFEYTAILRADPCSYCGGSAGTIDHIEPLHHGGELLWSNLTASCRSCNCSKGTQPLTRFLLKAA